jgi:hypothetical protein
MTATGDTGSDGISSARRAFLPSPTLPLAYFAGAHLALATAMAALIVRPGLPGAFHYHPRAIALVHLITLGWISGSILGALYIVGPLALGAPVRATHLDALACVSYWLGAVGVVAAFWTGRYDVLPPASLLVLVPLAFVGARMTRALWRSRTPFGVCLHIVLAFINIIGAGVAGLALAGNRVTGDLPWPPMSLALAHGHLAVLGWAIMMIFGVAYRLIPMFVPAAMPSGPALGISAVLLESGTLGLSVALITGMPLLPWVSCVTAAFVSFFVQIRRIVRQRRARPAELPARDWSTWQTHVAFFYLLLTAGVGIRLGVGETGSALAWVYGVGGLLGFVSQLVVGIQGRLLPLHAWYRSMDRRHGLPPGVSVHRLIEPRFALVIFVLWLIGVPVLLAGLATGRHVFVAAGAVALFGATIVNASYGALMVRRTG